VPGKISFLFIFQAEKYFLAGKFLTLFRWEMIYLPEQLNVYVCKLMFDSDMYDLGNMPLDTYTHFMNLLF